MSYQPQHGRAKASRRGAGPSEEETAEVTRIHFDEDTDDWIAASPAAGATRLSTPEEEAAAREQIDAELGSASRPTTVMDGGGASSARTAAMPQDAQRARSGVTRTVQVADASTPPAETVAMPQASRPSSDTSIGHTASLDEAKRKVRTHRVRTALGKVFRFVLKLVIIVLVAAVIGAAAMAVFTSLASDGTATLGEQVGELLEGLLGAASDETDEDGLDAVLTDDEAVEDGGQESDAGSSGTDDASGTMTSSSGSSDASSASSGSSDSDASSVDTGADEASDAGSSSQDASSGSEASDGAAGSDADQASGSGADAEVSTDVGDVAGESTSDGASPEDVATVE